MNATELMATLSSKLGIFVEFNSQGVCAINFDNDEVIFEDSDKGLYLIADIASSIGKESAALRLLNANFLGAQTANATIGHDETNNKFVLHLALDQELEYAVFEQKLELFIKALRYWKEWLDLYDGANENSLNNSNQFSNMGMLEI